MKGLTATVAFAASILAVVAWWKPAAGVTWNIQLSNPPSVSQATDQSYKVWDFDMFDSSSSLVSAFKSKGHNVVCYFSAGSFEDWRPDADQFPDSAKGEDLPWEGEKWLDTRDPTVRSIMKTRIQLAASMGCDAIDADNVDGYTWEDENGDEQGNDTGFPLTPADGVNYIQFLATTAHNAGLAYGLKNGGEILNSVVGVSDFVINESCSQYDNGHKCALYQKFNQQNKPVFHIEYTTKKPATTALVNKACKNPDAKGFSNLIKDETLSSWTQKCA